MTRRSVSVRGETYDALLAYAHARSRSASDVLEELIAERLAAAAGRPEAQLDVEAKPWRMVTLQGVATAPAAPAEPEPRKHGSQSGSGAISMQRGEAERFMRAADAQTAPLRRGRPAVGKDKPCEIPEGRDAGEPGEERARASAPIARRDPGNVRSF